MEIVKEGRWVKIEEYRQIYQAVGYERGCGLSFPCDKDGHVNLQELQKPALENWYKAQAGVEFEFEGVVDCSYEYYEHPVGQCECGARVSLRGDSMGELDCPKCGRVYNIFGQELSGFTQAWIGANADGEFYEDY